MERARQFPVTAMNRLGNSNYVHHALLAQRAVRPRGARAAMPISNADDHASSHEISSPWPATVNRQVTRASSRGMIGWPGAAASGWTAVDSLSNLATERFAIRCAPGAAGAHPGPQVACAAQAVPGA